MKALITGSRGFVGQHLTNLLESEGIEAIHYNLRDGQNLLDYETLRNTIDIYRPDYIFHLAAQAFVPESLTNPHRTFQHNIVGSLNLLEAVRQLNAKTRVLLAGTSEEYGDVIGRGKLTEDTLPQPQSPYAISKLAMDYLGQMYAKVYGLDIVTTRAFNHTGPGRGEMYAESAFAKQIVEIESGKRKVLEHGNLETVRNYTDVRDIVRAYRMAIDLPSGVYNICSPNSVKIQEVLDLLVKNSLNNIGTRDSPGLHRKGDFSFAAPSAAKFVKLTKWKPEYSLEQSMVDLLGYWREKLA